MSKYLTYFGITFKNSTTYKAGLFLGMAVDIIFFVIQFTVWKTVFSHSGSADIAGYTLSNTITYYFITNMIFRFDFMNSIYLGWQIWSGYFTNDLVKPWRIIPVYIIDTIAENSVAIILSIPIVAILFFAVRQYLTFPSGEYFFFFIITLLMGFVITILIALLLQSLTFFFGDQDANIEFYGVISDFLAGAMVPLVFLPQSIQKFVQFLPFRYSFFLPCQVFLQKVPKEIVYRDWLVGLAWIAALTLLLRFAYVRGLKFYTGTGR